MKNLMFSYLVLSTLLASCQKLNDSTSFPEAAKAPDYKVVPYQAKVAFPNHDDSSRVWFKGEEYFTYVQVFDKNNNEISKVVQVQGPYYTGTLSLPVNYKEVLLKFGSSANSLANSKSQLIVYPKGKD